MQTLTIRRSDLQAAEHTRFRYAWGALSAVKRYAREHGHALMLHGPQPKATLYYRDTDGRIRQKTWPKVVARD